MYRRMYQSLYHRPSGPVRPASTAVVAVSPLRMPAYGVPGARSLRFATPGPWPVPCLSARTSRGTDARWRSLQARGQGCAPAPRLAALARRWRVVKPLLFPLAIPSPRAIQGGVRGGVLARFALLFLFPLPIMDDTQKTIGLTELLEEVNRDLDELRKKHSSDYNIRNITMWWDLERERLAARHSPGSVVRKVRDSRALRSMMTWFFVGWLTMLVVQTTIRFLIG